MNWLYLVPRVAAPLADKSYLAGLLPLQSQSEHIGCYHNNLQHELIFQGILLGKYALMRKKVTILLQSLQQGPTVSSERGQIGNKRMEFESMAVLVCWRWETD
jgi:hypothetical protein